MHYVYVCMYRREGRNHLGVSFPDEGGTGAGGDGVGTGVGGDGVGAGVGGSRAGGGGVGGTEDACACVLSRIGASGAWSHSGFVVSFIDVEVTQMRLVVIRKVIQAAAHEGKPDRGSFISRNIWELGGCHRCRNLN